MNRKQRRAAAKSGHQAGPSPTVAGRFAGIAELLTKAVRHHQAGQLAEAEGCYRKILAIDENHFDGLHLFGVLAQQAGHSDLAEQLISKAIALNDRIWPSDDDERSKLIVPAKANRAVALSIAPVEAQHIAILNFVLGMYPVPSTFIMTDKAASVTDLGS